MRICSKAVRHLLIVAVFSLPVALFAQETMASLKDRNRILLIFSPTSATVNFVQQQHLFKNQATKLADRDLILIPVLRQWTSADFEARQANSHFSTATEQKHLRSRYNIQPKEFTIILLGKDGGEKFRSHTPVTIEELSSVIDSMPMRQQEIRQRTRSNTQSPRE